MSDTPRTDAAIVSTRTTINTHHGTAFGDWVDADFCRTLERELAGAGEHAHKANKIAGDALDERDKFRSYAERLARAMDLIVSAADERSDFKPLSYEDAYESAREDFAWIVTVGRKALATRIEEGERLTLSTGGAGQAGHPQGNSEGQPPQPVAPDPQAASGEQFDPAKDCRAGVKCRNFKCLRTQRCHRDELIESGVERAHEHEWVSDLAGGAFFCKCGANRPIP